MKSKSTHSEKLLKSIKEKLKRVGFSVKALADEIGVNYQTLYFAIKPERRTYRPSKRKPTFSYETGKALELWLQQ